MKETLALAEAVHASKHRLKGESFREQTARIASALTDSPEHFTRFRQLLLDKKFLPAGRIQLAAGSTLMTTLLNCFVAGTIEDSMSGIMQSATEAATTMRKGGGNGYSFSTIRPRGARISTLDSESSGAVSFMQIHNAVGSTVSSAGNRRGAQMGVLHVWHPDIEEFIAAKTQPGNLNNFNVSIAITDKFMECVKCHAQFPLEFNGVVYKWVDARALWDKIMRATWDWAEPGVIFIDRVQEMNNLWYCEDIAATNPCGEQPLPPYGACLLGSFNLTRITPAEMIKAMPDVVRAMDLALDVSDYPLEQHRVEAMSKRRMGLGVTGLANYLETTYGYTYGSAYFRANAESMFRYLTHSAYRASIELAKEKGAFPEFDAWKYGCSKFIRSLPEDIQQGISKYGIRNSHLISFAPTGTISLTAGNVSSGIEPVFSYEYNRDMITETGSSIITVKDYAYGTHGVRGRTASQCSISDHLNVLALATRYSDSAVSKTVNVGDDVTWEEFKGIYMQAYDLGCKGLTTYRAAGKRYGILNEIKPEDKVEGGACYIDPVTGDKECS